MAFSFLRILTYVLGLVGTSLLLPFGVALWKGETAVVPAFLVPMLAGWGVAIAFWLLARGRPSCPTSSACRPASTSGAARRTGWAASA